MPSLHRRVAALALLACSTTTLATPPPTDLACRFVAAADAAGRVALSFTLRNTGAQDLHLLRWGSPFEGAWFGPFVRVSTAQGELPFQGALRKRGDPTGTDYLLLHAGQSLHATLSLDDAFTLPARSPLTLKAAWRWHDVMSSGTPPRPRALHQGRDQDCGSISLPR